jgi:NAD(P)H-dependent FMN reductase
MTLKILALAGSTRTQSWNKKLVQVAANYVRAAGAEVTFVDLRDFPMPLYDGDLEAAAGLPDGAQALKRLMLEHDGFLISSPEYNTSISAVLKNAIDWVSRPRPNEPPGVAFRGKVAALLAASPGNLGGVRGMYTVRQVLNSLGVLVLPTQFGLARAHEAFADDGGLKDSAQQKTVAALAQELVSTLSRLKA